MHISMYKELKSISSGILVLQAKPHQAGLMELACTSYMHGLESNHNDRFKSCYHLSHTTFSAIACFQSHVNLSSIDGWVNLPCNLCFSLDLRRCLERTEKPNRCLFKQEERMLKLAFNQVGTTAKSLFQRCYMIGWNRKGFQTLSTSRGANSGNKWRPM